MNSHAVDSLRSPFKLWYRLADAALQQLVASGNDDWTRSLSAWDDLGLTAFVELCVLPLRRENLLTLQVRLLFYRFLTQHPLSSASVAASRDVPPCDFDALNQGKTCCLLCSCLTYDLLFEEMIKKVKQWFIKCLADFHSDRCDGISMIHRRMEDESNCYGDTNRKLHDLCELRRPLKSFEIDKKLTWANDREKECERVSSFNYPPLSKYTHKGS